jgi:hypothetical protein
MYCSSRRRAGALLLLITVVASIFTTATFLNTSKVHAATYGGQAQYQGKPGTITRIATSIAQPIRPVKNANGHKVMPLYPKYRHSVTVSTNSLPHAIDAGLVKNAITQGTVLHNFDGLNDTNQFAANGFEITPPDQGLCIGNDPNVTGTEVVFEPVNEVIRETAPDGGALPGAPLLGNTDYSFASFWNDPYAIGDPHCFYDQSTRTFFFTEIGSTSPNGPTTTDIAVYNASGFAVYQIDTSRGGVDFGDQPHVGYDQNALYVSTDEFNNSTGNYDGAMLFAISKSQLVAESSTVSTATFGPLSLGGLPVLTLQPAVSTSAASTEYLLNSFPILDSAFDPNPISKQLGLWKVTNDVNLGGAILSGTIIGSETYAFPIPAESTGDGTTTGGITSEAALNPDDSRMQQVQFINGSLWAALTTAVSVNLDPTARDGIAWFQIIPSIGRVVQQGYIASQGNYLIYPAIFHTLKGTSAITFTLTSASAKINPSAAYVVRTSTASSFGSIAIAASGSGPHLSFSDSQFGRARWGDYSAAVLDTNNSDIWLATEYIPTTQDPSDNWGTRVFDIKGV